MSIKGVKIQVRLTIGQHEFGFSPHIRIHEDYGGSVTTYRLIPEMAYPTFPAEEVLDAGEQYGLRHVKSRYDPQNACENRQTV